MSQNEELDWSSLGFEYHRTDWNARTVYRNGAWSDVEWTQSEYFPIHISAGCLHYGLEIFEGLKAFRGVDGKIRLFRAEENAMRMINSAKRLCMAAPSVEQFMEICTEAVRRNLRFLPPYESGASLYIRPLLIGTNPFMGVRPASEVMFVVFVSPVGAYFKGGIRPIDVVIDRDQDRAAPRGTGDVKVGGNYASSMYSGAAAHRLGYSNVLYLDAVERKYIEEFGAANFFAIKGNSYVTPLSGSVLPSITNKSLRRLATDIGLQVEERRIAVDELSSFDEAGACGTAAVIAPVSKVIDLQTNKIYDFGNEVGPWCLKMYNTLQDIQYGRAADPYGWITIIEE